MKAAPPKMLRGLIAFVLMVECAQTIEVRIRPQDAGGLPGAAPTDAGMPDSTDASWPREVDRWADIRCTQQGTCVRSLRGRVLCWGDSDQGQIPRTHGMRGSPIPFEVTLPRPATEIHLGGGGCAQTLGGPPVCWGPVFGRPLVVADYHPPFEPRELDGAVYLDVGAASSCMLDRERVLRCWTSPLDRGMAIQQRTLMTGTAVAEFRVGFSEGCVLDHAGGVVCWDCEQRPGDGGSRLGLELRPLRVELPGAASALSVSVSGLQYALVEGDVYRWQVHEADGCASGRPDCVPSRRVSDVPPLEAIAAGISFQCGITRAGGVHCWGSSTIGELGVFARTPLHVDIALPSRATKLAAGTFHACAILETNEVWCWGSNAAFQIGHPDAGRVALSRVEMLPELH